MFVYLFLSQHQNIKITEKLEKVKSKELLHEWKEDYRSNQQQLRRKRLVKGKGNIKKSFKFFIFSFIITKTKIIKKQSYKHHLALIVIIFQ